MVDDRKKKYEDKRVIKRASFNTTTEKDLLDFAESIDFSKWVKDKIREEMLANAEHTASKPKY